MFCSCGRNVRPIEKSFAQQEKKLEGTLLMGAITLYIMSSDWKNWSLHCFQKDCFYLRVCEERWQRRQRYAKILQGYKVYKLVLFGCGISKFIKKMNHSKTLKIIVKQLKCLYSHGFTLKATPKCTNVLWLTRLHQGVKLQTHSESI